MIDIDISRVVTEYQAQILIDDTQQRFVAEFPDKVSQPVQYGDSIKAHSVYLSQYQLLPYNRVIEYFGDQLGIPLSEGSIYNFNVEAARLIQASGAEAVIKQRYTPLYGARYRALYQQSGRKRYQDDKGSPEDIRVLSRV